MNRIFLYPAGLILSLVSLWVPASPQKYVHDYGHVTLDAAPQRIAALNWTQAEFLLSLGVTPVGVTTLKGYRHWQSNNPPMPEGVVELGHRAEPSLEALWQLQPDLILGYNWRHGRLYDRLQAIAPTALYTQYPSQGDPRNYLTRMEDNFWRVAQLLDRTTLAEQHIKELEQTLAACRQRIKDAGLSGSRVMVGKFVGMGLGLRTYGEGSLAGAILEALSLENAWVKTLPGRDFSHIDLTQLPLVGDASLMLIGEVQGEARTMTTSAVWNSLPAVKEERVYRTPNLWGFGGPVSAKRMAEEFTRQLTGDAG
ncbi:iron-siderophore ABC transporter substrate-binding protein [Parendozoicomonas haliclonae]|uniref:Iron(3+)-hydroxamate-binding protein FhuD n=1 Tax=Parendozoicomonas haliclonae TaxID=1960125 RepID=A0A1X7AS01_9GAMM|nr:iron-siderophore ABC transporter substrate-binding protein [Parendozoicomonas haliclonae]SMA50923.1 Iron(3+)-hydroxamate-binding protein FhuD precursor [Parendozoicomonas haliclonae]